MKIKKFFLNRKAEVSEPIDEILKRNKYSYTDIEELKRKVSNGELNPSKTLFITNFPGTFIKDCPCTPKYVSCLYKNINFAYGCPIGCTYCILQHYINYPTLTLFSNISKLKKEIKEYKKGKKFIRIGTGELTDSLVWEQLYPFSEWFIELFREHEDVIFEFKSKIALIQNFKKLKNNSNIMVSFSLNPKRLKKEERYASSIKERLKALGELEKKGYILGIHFDPIIIYNGYENDYKELIIEIFKHIRAKTIGWISLGALRFFEPLRWIIREKHKNSILLKRELIEGFDGKYRYPFLEREKAFKKVYYYLKKYGSDELPVYFCMESEEMWERVLKFPPVPEKINEYLWMSAKKAAENL